MSQSPYFLVNACAPPGVKPERGGIIADARCRVARRRSAPTIVEAPKRACPIAVGSIAWRKAEAAYRVV